MRSHSWNIPEIKCFHNRAYKDERGSFEESYNSEVFLDKDIDVTFVQDNLVWSKPGVFRGLHWQKPPFAQAKLVRCLVGTIFDYVVDIRKDSPTFMKAVIYQLSQENRNILYIPEGFAHGYYVPETNESDVLVQYKVNQFRQPAYERSLNWSTVRVDLRGIMSKKDKLAPSFQEIPLDDFF